MMLDKKTQLEFIDREIKFANEFQNLFTDFAARFSTLKISLLKSRKNLYEPIPKKRTKACAQTCEKPVN